MGAGSAECKEVYARTSPLRLNVPREEPVRLAIDMRLLIDETVGRGQPEAVERSVCSWKLQQRTGRSRGRRLVHLGNRRGTHTSKSRLTHAMSGYAEVTLSVTLQSAKR